MEKEIQDLSNVYVTLQDIETKGKYAMPMAMCIKTIEDVINKLNNYKYGGEKNESEPNI